VSRFYLLPSVMVRKLPLKAGGVHARVSPQDCGCSFLCYRRRGAERAWEQSRKFQPAPAASDSSSRLPVKRVVLYKNGIGYFEHTARVRGNQDLAIDSTTTQLNDVLKSLTVVDLGEGRISGVRYNSVAPLDERLNALRTSPLENKQRAPTNFRLCAALVWRCEMAYPLRARSFASSG
jgi:hypothetical protein